MHAVGPDIGTPALLFAAALEPDLFESIVCGGGAASVDAAGPALQDLINSPQGYFDQIEGGQFVLNLIKSGTTHSIPEDVLQDYRMAAAGLRWETQVNFVRAYKSELPELKKSLKEIQTPVLLIGGANDPIVPPANGRLLADHLPHNSYLLLDSGHFAWEEKPDDYGGSVRQWVSEGFRRV